MKLSFLALVAAASAVQHVAASQLDCNRWLLDNFARFDQAGSGQQDGLISPSDLQSIRDRTTVTSWERDCLTHIISYFAVFDNIGGGNRDGLISRTDIRMAIDQGGV